MLTPDFPPDIGGIQTLVFRVVAGLTRFRPTVVTVANNEATALDRSQPFRIVRVSHGSGHRLGVALLNAASVFEGVRRRPAVVLSAHIVTGPAALLIGRSLRRPVVQYVHAQELSKRHALAGRILRQADEVIAPSQYGRTLVEQIVGHRKGIRVIHPGCECAGSPPDPPMASSSIVVVARLVERYKGHDVLLRALPLVRDQVPGANLQIVGNGPLRTELECLAHSLGVASATTFHGAVSDEQRDSILSAASVFAMPSRIDGRGAGEGFGIVYVEAGAHGLPVVAGNVGGALDAVIHGRTGLLVDPESPEAVAAALTTVLQDRDRARQMGRAGWVHARSLSWARTASEVERVLDEVCAR